MCLLEQKPILIAQRHFNFMPTYFANYPTTDFKTSISLVLFVFVRLFQKQYSDREPDEHYRCADEVGKEVGIGFEYRAGAEHSGIILDGLCEYTSKA